MLKKISNLYTFYRFTLHFVNQIFFYTLICKYTVSLFTHNCLTLTSFAFSVITKALYNPSKYKNVRSDMLYSITQECFTLNSVRILLHLLTFVQ